MVCRRWVVVGKVHRKVQLNQVRRRNSSIGNMKIEFRYVRRNDATATQCQTFLYEQKALAAIARAATDESIWIRIFRVYIIGLAVVCLYNQ